MFTEAEFEELLGKTIVEIKGTEGSEEIIFKTSDGTEFVLYHSQDCCESVRVEDICGDLNDLLNLPILLAEEITHGRDEIPKDLPEDLQERYESFLWTFYKLSTNLGSVTIRWLGVSNGYYSEAVSCRRTMTTKEEREHEIQRSQENKKWMVN